MKNIFLAALIGLFQCAVVVGGEEPAADPETARSEHRLKYMRSIVDAMEVKPANADSKLDLRFQENPILRFGDSARATLDGSLWKMGAGRPQIIVAFEFARHDDRAVINYEFLCLTEEKFTLHTGNGWKWSPSGSAVNFQRLADAPEPHKLPVGRLRQMKLLTRRFAATQFYLGEDYTLRLLPQPIDRYAMDDHGMIHDGAVFVFANGTNPEVLLLLEAVGDGWQYGLVRMCGAAPTVKLDDQVVWTKPSSEDIGYSWEMDYTGQSHPVDPAALEVDATIEN